MKSVTLNSVESWCAEHQHATRGFPFGEQAAVYKVGGKMFATVALDATPTHVTLKVDPDDGEVLRQQYACIREGYYMNKRHWITVELAPELDVKLVQELIADSYRIVYDSLTKKLRESL
jgi:predicted DNA-binding protein (MmcQ/YjbR family)